MHGNAPFGHSLRFIFLAVACYISLAPFFSLYIRLYVLLLVHIMNSTTYSTYYPY